MGVAGRYFFFPVWRMRWNRPAAFPMRVTGSSWELRRREAGRPGLRQGGVVLVLYIGWSVGG